MKIKCLKCEQVYSIDDKDIPEKGATTTCKKCGNKILIVYPHIKEKTEEDTHIEYQNQKAASKTYAESSSLPSKKQLICFIDKNSNKYLTTFKEFMVDGKDKFSLTWHWPAFFVPTLWMFYRKMYLWGILSLFFNYIPFGQFFSMICFGVLGNYIYYKHAKKKIIKIIINNSTANQYKLNRMISMKGGVSHLIINIFIIIAIIGVLAAIAIPQFSAYQTRSYNSIAQSNLKNAAHYQETYYIDNGTYTNSIDELTNNTEFNVPQEVNLEILSSDENQYIIIASHNEGNRIYLLRGPNGEITEASSDDINMIEKDNQNNRGIEQLEQVAWEQIKSLDYIIDDVELIDIIKLNEKYYVVYYEVSINGFNGVYFLAPEANIYVIYDTQEDMRAYARFLRMSLDEKKQYLRNDFRNIAGYNFPME